MILIPQIVTPPTSDLLTLAEVKAHLKVEADVTAEDELIQSLIQAAESAWVQDSGRVLLASTWDQKFDEWGDCWHLCLDRYPVSSITAVTYTQSDGTTGTLSAANYYLSTAGRRPCVILKYSQLWPTAVLENGPSINVRYVAGAATAADVPKDIVAALMVKIGEMFADRDSQGNQQSAAMDRVWKLAVRRHRLEA